MSTFFVPDMLSFSTLSRNVSDLKARADTTRTESVTGRHDDLTKHLGGDVGSAHLLKKAVDDVRLFQQNLALSKARAETTQLALNGVSADSNRIATDTLAALGRNDTTVLTTLSDDAQTAVSAVFSALNTVFGGRALFGGDVTDRAPLAAPEQLISDVQAIIAGAIDAADAEAQLDIYFNDPAGGFATTIYQGGANAAPLVEISPGIRIDASTKADDQSVKDIIRSLAVIANRDAATFADANTLIENNSTRALGADAVLTEVRANIGVSEARIGDAIGRYEAEEAVLTSVYNNKTARDPYEAASELQLLETQLEASYLVTGRLARLSIANYLR